MVIIDLALREPTIRALPPTGPSWPDAVGVTDLDLGALILMLMTAWNSPKRQRVARRTDGSPTIAIVTLLWAVENGGVAAGTRDYFTLRAAALSLECRGFGVVKAQGQLTDPSVFNASYRMPPIKDADSLSINNR